MQIRSALEANQPEDAFSGNELAALRYAAALTLDPGGLSETTVKEMRAGGLSDGEILEVNQVTAYFAYANRTVLGLGVSAGGETLGLAPSAADDADDWGHR